MGTFTAVVCAKDEDRTIEAVIRGCLAHTNDILVVDGHSRDRTADIARNLGVPVLLDHGLGKGDAIRTAVESIKCDVAVFVDADGSHNTEDIPRLIAPIKADKFDLVIASRYMRDSGSEELHGTLENFIRRTGSRITTSLINMRFGTELTDVQNGFRALRTSVLKDLNLVENITTIEQEMVIKALKKGCRLGEIPSREFRRMYGESRICLWKASSTYIFSLLRDIF